MSQINYNITLDISEMRLEEAEAFIDMIRKRAKVDHLSNLKWDILGRNPQLMGPLPGEDKNQKLDTD
jgi:hypothetical protein